LMNWIKEKLGSAKIADIKVYTEVYTLKNSKFKFSHVDITKT